MLKKIKLTIHFLWLGLCMPMHSQQTPVFTNYTYNTMIINPSFTGFYDHTDISFTSSGNFSDIEGAPRNTNFLVNTSVKSKNIGLGIGVQNDKIGVLNTTSLYGAFSYKIRLPRTVHSNYWWDYNPRMLSFGISGGIVQWDERLTALGIQNDPNFSSDINTTVPLVNVGALYNDTRFFIGVSVHNLIQNPLDSSLKTKVNLERSVYTHAGYRFFSSRYWEEVLITPSLLLKYVKGAPLQLDTNILFNFKNKFELGAGYRSAKSINTMLGVYLGKHFHFLYNYTFGIQKQNPLGNTHGIVLRFRLGEGFTMKR